MNPLVASNRYGCVTVSGTDGSQCALCNSSSLKMSCATAFDDLLQHCRKGTLLLLPHVGLLSLQVILSSGRSGGGGRSERADPLEVGVRLAELPLLLLNPAVESRLWPLAGVARAACW